MIKDYQDFRNEIDMLNGNIARICVTDNLSELDSMFSYAMKRLNSIVDYKCKKIRGHKKEE